MNISKEKVTPKKAAEWISRNINNRPLSQKRVGLYADAMLDGQWKLNGETIKFNSNGDLIDGQHRLTACIRSGVSFECYVVRGLEHDAFDTIDQGKSRSISDVFCRHGQKHYTMLAASTRWVWMHAKGHMSGTVRADVATKILEENPGLINSVQFARSLRGKNKLVNGGLLGFLVYGSDCENEEESRQFWSSVIEGVGLNRGTPGYLLHQRLVNNLSAVAKLSSKHICALSIKAWNQSRLQNPPRVLKFVEGEEFPKFTELKKRTKHYE